LTFIRLFDILYTVINFLNYEKCLQVKRAKLMSIELEWIKARIKNDEYEVSSHAENERQAEKISLDEIESAILSGEILEDYPDDPRGPNCLILGYIGRGCSVHIVCGKTLSGIIRIITVYIPCLPKWIDERTRRKK